MTGCPKCNQQDVGEIEFSSMGPNVRFYFCRSCENRWWRAGTDEIELNSVLEAATVFARAS